MSLTGCSLRGRGHMSDNMNKFSSKTSFSDRPIKEEEIEPCAIAIAVNALGAITRLARTNVSNYARNDQSVSKRVVDQSTIHDSAN